MVSGRLLLAAVAAGAVACTAAETVTLCPANGAKGVDVDTHLTLTFSEAPTVGAQGWIRIYDVKSGECVDSLDLSVPAGPTESRTYAPDIDYTKVPYGRPSPSTIATTSSSRTSPSPPT